LNFKEAKLDWKRVVAGPAEGPGPKGTTDSTDFTDFTDRSGHPGPFRKSAF